MQQPFPHPNPSQLLGAVISTKLTNGETFTGEIFCYDPHESNTIVLKEGDAEYANFHIIKTQYICELFIKSLPYINPPKDNLPVCTLPLLDQRERDGRLNFQKYKHTIGIHVSQEAQDIFDFIHKTHPDCCWEKDSCIRVMGVVVSPPYRPENCEGAGSAVERIKQVLEGYHERQKQNKKKQSSPLTTASTHMTPVSVNFQPQSIVPSLAAVPQNVDPNTNFQPGMTFIPAPSPGQPIVFVDQNGVPINAGAQFHDGRFYQNANAPGFMIVVMSGNSGLPEESMAQLQQKPQHYGAPLYTTATAPGQAYRGPFVFAVPPPAGAQLMAVPKPAALEHPPELAGNIALMQTYATAIPHNVVDFQGRQTTNLPAMTIPEIKQDQTVYTVPQEAMNEMIQYTQGRPPAYRSPPHELSRIKPSSSPTQDHTSTQQQPTPISLDSINNRNFIPTQITTANAISQNSPKAVQESPQQHIGNYSSQYKYSRWIPMSNETTRPPGETNNGPSPISTPPANIVVSSGSTTQSSTESAFGSLRASGVLGGIMTSQPQNAMMGAFQRGGKGGRAQRNRINRRRE